MNNTPGNVFAATHHCDTHLTFDPWCPACVEAARLRSLARYASPEAPLGVFEVLNSRSSHLVTLFASDLAATEQEWEWNKIGGNGREHGRGAGEPLNPRVNVLPVGAVEQMIRAAVLAEREACAQTCDDLYADIERKGHEVDNLPGVLNGAAWAAEAIRARK